MYVRIDEESLLVAEIINFDPHGKYHPSLKWIKVPTELEDDIGYDFWYDGESLNPPTDE